jgi:hypothetical protein
MPLGYWNAHSDLDWQDACGMYGEPADDDQCAMTITARRELLRQAHDLIERAERHERWDCSARDYCSQAADMLRRAGLPELADDCADEFGIEAAAILKEIDAEGRR